MITGFPVFATTSSHVMTHVRTTVGFDAGSEAGSVKTAAIMPELYERSHSRTFQDEIPSQERTAALSLDFTR